eukprot:TRINITY_DN3840_c0_g1_i1.p1 TRINITY_DN3840_c0_g1~~TRINITY_DN3840_c0_g1_i1.p1  ORF type:complete len:417 (+),score=42.99 TRINITY_DN3840_c0_g1_i1:401-1651(+)
MSALCLGFLLLFSELFTVQLCMEQISSGITSLGFKLMDELCESNCVLSPYSIHAALAMVVRGAKGETRSQILEFLNLSISTSNMMLDESMENYRELLLAGEDNLEIANGLFLDQSFPISQSYYESLTVYHDAYAEVVDFQLAPDDAWESIDEYVLQATNSQISELIPRGAIDATTRMVLVNAIFFKGLWQTVFNQQSTDADTFHINASEEVLVPTMYTTGNFKYGTLQSMPQVSFVELPYSVGEISLFIILPKSLESMSWVMEDKEFGSIDYLKRQLALEPDLINQLKTTGIESSIDVQMPKFTLEFESGLSEVLQDLGVTQVFSPGLANLSDMVIQEEIATGNRLYLSEGYHKAKIVVDEEGTTAAAGTGLLIAERSAFDFREQFIVDQPFIFMLVDKSSDTTLVMGIVRDPSEM